MTEKKRTIGIMTLHRALNYGAVWQTWALKTICERLGFEVHVIDYNPFGHYKYTDFIRKNLLASAKKILNFRNFNRFVDEQLDPTQHTESHEWIVDNAPNFDFYIVGSDTVWCKATVGDFLNSYMLDFAPETTKRIAYAASLGGDKRALETEVFAAESRTFKTISLREPLFVGEVENISGVTTTDVCDPTLLLTASDYERMEQKCRCPKEYILVFDLVGDELIKQKALQLKAERHLPILNISTNAKSWADSNCQVMTPQQWLYLIHHANVVCTNSFHGLALSIIYGKEFIVCQATKGGRVQNNVRVENLLTQCYGAENLQSLYSDYVFASKDIINLSGGSLLERYRQRSLDWLKKALE
ncbi:MAG: polysaccharide pyruvyl transferase family protein [Paludibacteraceae bacterium]|nr:polysaccharide pyruvyl transferase family protein [Paludibacteraceae bacterium]